ncbi:hypothetical protein A4X13_0g1906 [Tilletia indica]|uniref:Uncharacterized protein n=1 Tax=Tilletia indica TaxID=43049 RepID=A0A177TJV4_9BASI|nr:hypothetical protein A4X13_0g1906 [Tilletia indica]
MDASDGTSIIRMHTVSSIKDPQHNPVPVPGPLWPLPPLVLGPALRTPSTLHALASRFQFTRSRLYA